MTTRYMDVRGYIIVRVGGRRVAEHRVVAEQKLGRPLRKGEVVHHCNGQRDDNRPENLRVFSSSAAHVRHHWRRRSIAFVSRHARYVAAVTGWPFPKALDYACLRHERAA